MDKYVITLSQVFPVTHNRSGEPTGFKDKFLAAIKQDGEWWKLHTIRANYELWKKRFEKIEKGEACLCIRQWSGKPYRSKQVEIARLTREDGIGLQALKFTFGDINKPVIVGGNDPTPTALSHNDGLSETDWRYWFSGYDLTQTLAVINFTSFRY